MKHHTVWAKFLLQHIVHMVTWNKQHEVQQCKGFLCNMWNAKDQQCKLLSRSPTFMTNLRTLLQFSKQEIEPDDDDDDVLVFHVPFNITLSHIEKMELERW